MYSLHVSPAACHAILSRDAGVGGVQGLHGSGLSIVQWDGHVQGWVSLHSHAGLGTPPACAGLLRDLQIP